MVNGNHSQVSATMIAVSAQSGWVISDGTSSRAATRTSAAG